ncbi:hypothetical protein [Nocardioides litoris]|uniref:hypothetical protein n=1 Tax=Nocardioides litoris TaxID=1926648 RepID=UPI0011217909|nr:hypothetical protein [Nocardioides litoris]
MIEEPAVARVRTTLLGLLAGALSFLLPTLSAGVDGTTTIAGTLLAVAVAALVASTHERVLLAVRGPAGGVAARRPVPLVLTTRATDPVHHPLRPRAPGRA